MGMNPKMEGEDLGQILGEEPQPQTGGVAPDFDSRFGEIEATGFGHSKSTTNDT